MNRFHRLHCLHTLALAGAVALAALASAPAGAQVICEKIGKPGKFKVRDACKEGKEDEVVDLAALITLEDVPDVQVPRTFVFGATGNLDTVGSTPELLPIDGNAESLSFETTAPSTNLHITFSAECAMVSDLIGGQTEVTLFLDGEAIAPTEGDDDAFCSATNNLVGTGITASRTVVVEDVGPGVHVFEVQARTDEDGAAINESSTSIVASEN